jgi:hypothetical protein
MIMIKMNYVLLVCVLNCSVFAMDYDGLTPEQKLRLGRKLENMEPDNRRQLRLWQENNRRDLEMENKENLKILEFEGKRLIHELTMDRETYLQRYGTPEELYRYTERI